MSNMPKLVVSGVQTLDQVRFPNPLATHGSWGTWLVWSLDPSSGFPPHLLPPLHTIYEQPLGLKTPKHENFGLEVNSQGPWMAAQHGTLKGRQCSEILNGGGGTSNGGPAALPFKAPGDKIFKFHMFIDLIWAIEKNCWTFPLNLSKKNLPLSWCGPQLPGEVTIKFPPTATPESN